LRNLCSSFQESDSRVVCESNADSIQGDFDHSKLTDAFKSLFAGAVKFKQNDDGAAAVQVSLKASENNAVIEWSGLPPLNHDPFPTVSGSDEIRLSLAKKIIEAHGGSTNLADQKLVVVLPLSGS